MRGDINSTGVAGKKGGPTLCMLHQKTFRAWHTFTRPQENMCAKIWDGFGAPTTLCAIFMHARIRWPKKMQLTCTVRKVAFRCRILLFWKPQGWRGHLGTVWGHRTRRGYYLSEGQVLCKYNMVEVLLSKILSVANRLTFGEKETFLQSQPKNVCCTDHQQGPECNIWPKTIRTINNS